MPNSDFSLGDYFSTFEHLISKQLISRQSLVEVQQFSNQLPGNISDFFGFECPLDNNKLEADFLLCSTKSAGKNAILAGLHTSIDMQENLFKDLAWQIVRKFCRDWENPESILYSNLLNIWLEFDISQQQAPYSPCIFFGTPDAKTCTVSHSTIIEKGLEILAPEALEGKRKDAFLQFFDQLPEQVHVFQVGAMLSRKSTDIRLCLRNIEPNIIVPTLVSMGWSGDKVSLSQLVQNLMPLTERIDVDIDLGEKIGNKIGLECYFGANQHTLEKLTCFTEWMVKQNLTSSEKAEGLRNFHGLYHQDIDPQKWPEHLLKLAKSSGNTANFLRYWVHHIKVVHQSIRPLSAKAYLAIEPNKLDRDIFKKQMSIK